MERSRMRRWAAVGAGLILWMAAVPAAQAAFSLAASPPSTSSAVTDVAAASAEGGQAPVQISAPSAILMEASTGQVIFEKNAHEQRNPASITKVMTLIVAFDAIRDGKVKLEDKVTISEEAAAQVGTIIFADEGETFTLGELLQSVAVGSANDAAVAVAEHVSGSVEAFVQAMNQKAQELGMKDTTFRNPTGLSAEGHLTSAYDIALMGRYAALNYPELIKLTSVYEADLQVPWRKNGPVFKLWNNNKLLTWYPGADGLKTGWTEAAGYCLAATASRNGVRMISVIMGADTWKRRNAEAAKLLDYGFANYTAVELAAKDQPVGKVSVNRGKSVTVEAVPKGPFLVGTLKGQQDKLKPEVRLPKSIEAPVTAGQSLGEIVALVDGQEVARMPLVAAQEVPRATFWESLLLQTKRLFSAK